MAVKIYEKIIAVLEKFYPLFFVLSAVLIIFLSFYRLDAYYINSWDEARHGVNAYEMTQTGNYVVNTYDYEHDYWNLKPPLSYYGILLGFKLFGTNAFGLRFYSALAYSILCILTGLFVKRYGKLESLLTMGFLAANTICFYAHMVRSGDADSLYVLFFTAAMLAMFLIPKYKNMLYLCGLMFALAFLTKSWHSLLIVAIGGLYLLISGEIKKLNWKQWLLFIGSFVVPLLLWAGIRFSQDGIAFFKNMVTTDLLARTATGVESHNAGPSYYYDFFFRGDYIYLTALIICLIGIVYYHRKAIKENLSDIAGYSLWILLPFILFSAAATKLAWYMYPILIPLFIVASILLGKLLKDKGIAFWLKYLLLIASILIMGHYIKLNFTQIRNLPGDPFQSFITESTGEADMNLPAYIQVNGDFQDEPYRWSQNSLFLAEINGNHNCENGGADSFITSKSPCVLYISKDYYTQSADKLSAFAILYQNDSFLLLYNEGKE